MPSRCAGYSFHCCRPESVWPTECLQNQFSLVLHAELRFVMGEAFAGSGEVFVDRFEMIFQRLVKFLVHAATQFGLKPRAALIPDFLPLPKATVAKLFSRFPEASRPRKWAQR